MCSYFVIFSVVLTTLSYTYGCAPSTTQDPPTASNVGVWSPWVANACNDTCGMCGMTQMIRICIVAGTCTGNSTMTTTTPCGSSPCPFPRNACCPGFRAGVSSGAIVCLSSSG